MSLPTMMDSTASMSISRATLSGNDSDCSMGGGVDSRPFSEASMSSALSEGPFQAKGSNSTCDKLKSKRLYTVQYSDSR